MKKQENARIEFKAYDSVARMLDKLKKGKYDIDYWEETPRQHLCRISTCVSGLMSWLPYDIYKEKLKNLRKETDRLMEESRELGDNWQPQLQAA